LLLEKWYGQHLLGQAISVHLKTPTADDEATPQTLKTKKY